MQVELLYHTPDPERAIATAAHPIADVASFMNPNVVKVVLNKAGRALDFTRAPAPGVPSYSRIGKSEKNTPKNCRYCEPKLGSAPSQSDATITVKIPHSSKAGRPLRPRM